MRRLLRDAGLLFVAILGVLLAGLFLGGVIATGQAEPQRWWPALAGGTLIATVVALWRKRRPPWGLPLLAGSGGAIAILLFCLTAASGRLLPLTDPSEVQAGRPPLLVMSALPLFRREGAGVAETLHGPDARAPAIMWLERWFAVRPLDRLDEGALHPGDRLLVAQPRLLRPEELVALDAWVRGGGRAVMLADPLLLWPLDLPLGDRRRPPATSLLDPLLAHWGLTLLPVPQGAAVVDRRFLAQGELLPLAGASRFEARGSVCRTVEDGLVAVCQIGRGRVRLVADADLLDDRLWLTHEGALTGDSMAYLRRSLLDPLGMAAGRPAHRWIRDDAALLAGVRWAMMFGTGWAVLGALLLRRWDKLGDGLGASGKNGKTQGKH